MVPECRPNWFARLALIPAHQSTFGAKVFVEQALRERPFVEQIQQIDPTGKSVLVIRSHVKPFAQKYSAFPKTQITL